MVLNSTVIANESASIESCRKKDTTAHLVVNTTDFNDQDFNEFLTISEGIERNHRQRKSNRRSRNNTIVATMTREEIFESTNLDDDQYLNALEHQTTYDGMSMNKTVLLNSIENLLKYFDEDIAVDDSSSKSSPTKLKAKGKVALAMASLRNKAGNLTHSPFAKRKNKQQLTVNTNIQELKKRYELSPDVSVNKAAVKLSPKFHRKSKVKQMASLFNTKINSMMRKDSPEPCTPEPMSPGLEAIASPKYTSTLKPKSPKLKQKLPSFISKLPSPKPSPLLKRKHLQKSPSITSLTAGSPFTRRKQLQKQPSTTCLVAENVFSQLTVKDKALLYNKFIGDMSKQNPKFSKHAQVLENNVQKEISRGEVIFERQGTVKNIRDSLEAKFTPTSGSTISKTLQRFKRSPSDLSFSTPPKSKEFEDVLRSETPTTPLPDDCEDPLHVSTLTVVLKTTPVSKKNSPKPRTNRKKRDVRFHTDLCVIEPSFKRTQTMIRPSIQVEPFAPPKKIRRTQHERLAPKMFFQNQHLEELFYSWLKEKNGVAFDITALNNRSDIIEIIPKNSKDNVIPKHKVDILLEKAINKLEAENKRRAETRSTMEDCAIKLIKKTVEEEVEKSIIEVELPLEMEMSRDKECLTKEANEDSDLGVTSITKTTSEDSSQTEAFKETDSVQISQNSSLMSLKPMRKKKLKRSLTWKKESSLVEANTILSTDSDSDGKSLQPSKSLYSTTLPKTKKCSTYVKKLLFKTINSSVSSVQSNANQPELSIVELDRSLIRQVNSPTKIKNAYTLTIMSSPSPPTESDFCDSDLPHTPIKDLSCAVHDVCPIEEKAYRQILQSNVAATDFTDLQEKKMEQEHSRLMIDSFIDQGFETGSNDMESPMRLSRKLTEKNVDLNRTQEENPKNFSTPLKGFNVHQIFTAPLEKANQPHLISPISSNTSMYRKNLTMQVIKEGCPLEGSMQAQSIARSLNANQQTFIVADGTTCDTTTPPLGETHKLETSQFWIASGDFTVGLNIHYYEAERLLLLSNIFGQKCMEHRSITFGIDQQIFAPNAAISQDDLLRKVPKIENCSQYWFSTGDVLLPFAGKKISEKKVELFFSYIREFMEEGHSLRFGIDTFEFSQIYQVDDNYTSSTWPSSTQPVKTSDLDQSDFESVELEQSLTFSALGANQSDSASLRSEDLMSSNRTQCTMHDEGDNTLDQIFEDARNLNLSKTQTDQLALETQFTVPEMLKTLQNQQMKLKTLEERMLSCAPSGRDKSMAHFTESPEYMRKLRSIISAIDSIGRGNGFNACSIEQLESFMFFLSRYADLCLANCTAHIEKILDVVMQQRTFQAG